jgi:hypothetical protein
MRWRALPEQQTGGDQAVERRVEFYLPLVHHCSQQGMRKFTPNCRPYLRHLLGWTEPVEPRHQRRVQASRNRQRW